MSEANAPDPKPSATATLMKLVVLPAVVVLALVVVIAWLASPGTDVEALVESLEKPGDARLAAAVELAAALDHPDNDPLRRDPILARRLADVLQREIETGGMEPDELRLRTYLCRALGGFQVADPLPALLTASKTQRSEQEVEVQLTALRSVGSLASHLDAADLQRVPQLLDVLLASAADPRPEIRERAAFVLGVVGGDRAMTQLETMLQGQPAEVRYNAATALARHGNAAGAEVLLEMLTPSQTSGKYFSRSRIHLSALEAIDRLLEAGASDELDELRPAVERLTRGDVETPLRVKAVEVLERW
ncbi:MAG TPA: HEAT repeat domain-containing protein [Thermoguttaceae bacterium]|nr:HEAT repeat domain-containing protein [Thermoguttaceae bacterium]